MKPEAAVTTLWGLDERSARQLLNNLERKALLSFQGESPKRMITLHDLQYDYLQCYLRQAPENSASLHKKLLEAYQKKCRGGWPAGPNDGYFYQHLAHHLIPIFPTSMFWNPSLRAGDFGSNP